MSLFASGNICQGIFCFLCKERMLPAATHRELISSHIPYLTRYPKSIGRFGRVSRQGYENIDNRFRYCSPYRVKIVRRHQSPLSRFSTRNPVPKCIFASLLLLTDSRRSIFQDTSRWDTCVDGITDGILRIGSDGPFVFIHDAFSLSPTHPDRHRCLSWKPDSHARTYPISKSARSHPLNRNLRPPTWVQPTEVATHFRFPALTRYDA